MPSKRARKIPEKLQVSQEDLVELKNTNENQPIADTTKEVSSEEQNEDLSIEELKEVEANDSQEDTDTSNS